MKFLVDAHLLAQNFDRIVEALAENSFVELDRQHLTIH